MNMLIWLIVNGLFYVKLKKKVRGYVRLFLIIIDRLMMNCVFILKIKRCV